MSTGSFTFTLNPTQGKQLEELLQSAGFEFKKVPYAHFGAKKGKCSISWYESGKLVVQGKDARDFIEFTLEPLVLQEARLGYEAELDSEMFAPHFGIDEAGKGDFFGPLVVAGAYVDEKLGRKLQELGVVDSKRITSDAKSRRLAAEIRKVLGPRCDVIAIGPARYNELVKKFGNVNKLLSWGHARMIEVLRERVPDCPRALSDQFGNPAMIEKHLKAREIDIQLDSRTKAESDIAVAAASILARATFLDKLSALGEPLGVQLAKGAGTPVDVQAKELAQSRGAEVFDGIAKTHFRTHAKALGLPPPDRPDPSVFRRKKG